MEWWGWAILGFIFLAGELLTPGGFYLLFLGASALMVAALDGLVGVHEAWVQWLLFSLGALAMVGLLRERLLTYRSSGLSKDDRDDLIGERAAAERTIPANGTGKVAMRGSTWSARNASPREIPEGAACKVVRVKGLELEVEPI